MYEDATSIGGLLDSVLKWEVTENIWQRIDEVVDLLTTAIERGDPVATRRAVAALVLSGPRRAGTGLGEALKQPPQRRVSPRTRDVIIRLLHQIGLPSEPERDTARGAEEPGDPGERREELAPNAGRDNTV
jgi:hypothetical protein